MTEHYSADFDPDEDGWWTPRCVCGFEAGPCPTAEDACDALMDHAAQTALDERTLSEDLA